MISEVMSHRQLPPLWNYTHTRSINSNAGKVCICVGDTGFYGKKETISLPFMTVEYDFFTMKKKISEIIWVFREST